MNQRSRFNHLKASPEVIRLTEMLFVGLALLLRNVEDLLYQCGIEVSRETVWVCAAPNCSAYKSTPTAIVQPSRRLDQRPGT